MANINVEDVDLGRTLGSTSQSVDSRLNSSAGAGGNANSRIDIAFAASDPLSELVWSPHSGLILKCADSSLADNKPLLLGNVDLNLNELSTSQSIKYKGSADDKVVHEEKSSFPNKMLNGDDEFDYKSTLFRSSRDSCSFELDALHRSCYAGSIRKMEVKAGTVDATQKEESRKDNIEEDLCSSQNIQIADVAESSKRNEGVNIPDIAESSKRNAENSLADGSYKSKIDMATSWQFSSKLIERRCNPKSTVEVSASRSNIIGSAVPIRSRPQTGKLSESLVCSLPNLQCRQEEDAEVMSASGDTKKSQTSAPISIPAPAPMDLECSAENDLAPLAAKGDFLRVDMSPTDSRICLYRENGKEKAGSDGNFGDRSLNDEDDNSRESMESCNSVGFFPKGIKRQWYDEEQLDGSKRMKKQVHGSTSVARLDSSFMNWISNMVKGLSDSNKRESSSLPLALARPDNVHSGENLLCNKVHDSESPKIGFHTVFRSLYYRDTKMSESGVKKGDYSIENAKELIVADKKSLGSFPPSCERNNDNSCKQIVVSNKEVNRHTSPRKPWNFSTLRNSVENKASGIMVCDMAKGEVSPSDSLSKERNITRENTRTSNIPLAMSSVPEKSNPQASLWITRLYTRSSRLENSDQITKEALPTANLDCGTANIFSNDDKFSEARDDSAEDRILADKMPKASVAFKSTRKPTPLQLSDKLRSSEAMTYVLAKRLDALRHIIHPSEKEKSSTCTLICFFCGRSDHDLRKCPELTKAEVEDLLVKISSFDKVEESPRFCIRCFQFDHWAISCHLALSSQRHRRSETRHVQLLDGGKENEDKAIAALNMACSSKKPRLDYSPSNYFKDKQNLQWCNFVSANKAGSEEEMFHAIRKLRLSRSDVLKWMDSSVSLSHLNGFFLRLRLGKVEAGLGWTGYYVARVTGCTMENMGCKSKKSILVDVGGIKSSVGSQYVSNHDFLEEEIKAWCKRTVRTGGKIPMLDELNSKFEDRKGLPGF